MAKGKNQIKRPKVAQGRFAPQDPPDYENMPPLFSLEQVQNGSGYGFADLDGDHKLHFAESIHKRRTMTWSDVRRADRHSLGTEQIPVSAIKVAIPSCITPDFKNFLVMRYYQLRPMVGYRTRNVFYVLWFDKNFTLYNHGG